MSIDAALRGSVGALKIDLAMSTAPSGVTALFGASGSGKTTVLRALAGLRRLSGWVQVGGATWQDDAKRRFRPAHKRPVGYVFQEASLFPHLSVAGNLDYAWRRRNRTKGGHRIDRDQVIETLALPKLLDRSPATLSGGERQRVALGRALLSQPSVLLMDEPLAALDRRAKEEILPYLQELATSFRAPIIYVSHDIAEVSRLADRVMVLSEGKITAEGPVSEIFERLDLGPELGRFEAGVVLTAQVQSNNLTYLTSTLDVSGQQVVAPAAHLIPGETVRLRIRARDVSVATERPRGVSIRNILTGVITEIAAEPKTAFAELKIDIGGQRLRARITRHAIADLGLRTDQAVYCLIKSIAFDRGAVGKPRPNPDG
ncbi:MAG: molybdenum ABC transporter ATP-binding protein [Alphaproteobacteria bacterium]|nr:molybdenum ABC transporter ATP-binding protein [Alphaproteobacteria bacterium]